MKKAVSVRVKPEVWRRVKELAAANGQSLERVVERALMEVEGTRQARGKIVGSTEPAANTLARDMSHAPVGSWDERQVTGEGRATRHPRASATAGRLDPRIEIPAPPSGVEKTCQRCGHLVRKHTPVCYEVGCVCRGAHRDMEETL